MFSISDCMGHDEKPEQIERKSIAEIEPLIINKLSKGATDIELIIWADRHHGVNLTSARLKKIKRKHGIK